jgi:hypothetical protein
MAWSSRRRSSLVSIVAAAVVTAGLAAATAVAQPKGKPAPTPAPGGDAGSGAAGAGSGSAAAPAGAPGETTAVTEAAEAGEGADVDALRQEYLELRDELFASRARAAAVASTLYSTRVTIKLTYGSGRFYNVRRATIRLDGANVFDDTEGAIASNDAVRFEGYVAPGRHLLTVRVAAAGKDDDRFTSTTETTAVIFAAQGKDLTIVGKVDDGGDIPYQWQRKQEGTYKLSVDLDVKTSKHEGGAPVARAAGGKGAGGK